MAILDRDATPAREPAADRIEACPTMLRHLPNAITAARGLCGPVVMLLLLEWGLNFAAFWLFIAAISTDMVDGFLARRLGVESRLALFLDPFSDKLLTGCAWAALGLVGYAPWPLVGLLLLRDFVVGVIWAWGTGRGRIWEPRPLGQTSVAFEGVAITVLLFHGPWMDVHWPTVGTVLGAMGFALSMLQLLEYAVRPSAFPAPSSQPGGRP
jgi:CDP-diacylglycerol--glycerol-3-phosphate 3-phosphatidyltransferase